MSKRRDGTIWPSCTPCGTIWRQSGNRTGHCSQCHRTFQGEAAFTIHQRHDGRGVICNDPASMRTVAGVPVYELVVGAGQYDAGVDYWSRRVSDEQRASFEALNAQRRAAR